MLSRRTGRPKGSTDASDFKMLLVLLKKRPRGFQEVVKEAGLARGTVSSCLKRLIRSGLVSKTNGKRPTYRLVDERSALGYVENKIHENVKIVVRDIARFRYRGLPPILAQIEEHMFKSVPNGVAFEDYYGFHPPSVDFLIYTMKEYPNLMKMWPGDISRVEDDLVKWLMKMYRTYKWVQREKKWKKVPWLERSGRAVAAFPGIPEKATLPGNPISLSRKMKPKGGKTA